MHSLIKAIKSLLHNSKILIVIILVLSVTLIQYESWFGPNPPVYSSVRSENVIEEFRAVWIASVANINWPSEPGLSVEQQQREAIELLDAIAAANMNAVILQVRPQADALYPSDLEPWSYYLSGEQGKAPEPFYDPLEFWIHEAHQRGLELHAWINPYRAHHMDGGPVSEHSIVNQLGEHIYRLKNDMYWMDPTQAEIVDHSLAVIKDIVARYDLDGLHYDDYFYPYPSYNEGAPFPDGDNYSAYQSEGGTLTINDWRRKAVNDFVKAIYDEVKRLKPHVKVGISPFGIWRPDHPPLIKGFDQYDQLYADAKLWLNKGWLDYYTPQLYWNISKIPQSFPILLAWWAEQNTESRHLWPGLSTYAVATQTGETEVINQIMVSRALLGSQDGHVLWNVKAIADHPHFAGLLQKHVFNNQAIVPPSPWLDNIPPEAPEVSLQSGLSELVISWSNNGQEAVFRWILYYKKDNDWHYDIYPTGVKTRRFDTTDNITAYAVVAVDRTGQQSQRINRSVASTGTN